MLKSLKDFFWNNRKEIAVGTACAVAGYTIFQVYRSHSLRTPSTFTTTEGKNEKKRIKLKHGVRQRLLLRVRRHFDFASCHLLSTLKLRCVEVADISGSIAKLKKLRNGSELSSESKLAELQLWEDIKISAFTLMFVSIYSTSIICVILRIQLHILARNSILYTDDDLVHTTPSEVDMRALIEGTYKYIFEEGIENLSAYVRKKVSSLLEPWVVNEKLNLSWLEFSQTMIKIRREIESDLNHLIYLVISRKYFGVVTLVCCIIYFQSYSKPEPSRATSLSEFQADQLSAPHVNNNAIAMQLADKDSREKFGVLISTSEGAPFAGGSAFSGELKSQNSFPRQNGVSIGNSTAELFAQVSFSWS